MYLPGKFKYLAGDIYLPVWGPITTTEARLIPTDCEVEQEFDNTVYEEQMFYFNTTTRVGRYHHDAAEHGLDYCYDCKAEVEILRNYLIKIKGVDPSNTSAISSEIIQMSKDMSSACARDRTLLSGNLDPEDRKEAITARQWVDGRPAYEKKPEPDRFQVSEFASRQMAKMGHVDGTGLGATGTGMT